MTAPVRSPKWLLLLLQLPARPAAARMMAWRRLRQLGSVAIKNSVHALPNTAQAREDFEWLRAEVVAAKGQASIMVADAMTAAEDAALRDAFLTERAAAYDLVRRDVGTALRGLTPRAAGARRPAAERARRAARDEVARLDAMELIPTEARARALAAIERLEARLAPGDERTAAVPAARRADERFHACTWVTRSRPGVDRMASAWLIRRFIDPKAAFAFAADPPPEGDRTRVAFDMFGGGFAHEGDRCTFEVLCDRFGLRDEGVRHIAKIVHDVDLKDDRYRVPDAPVVARMVEGLRATHADDHDLLSHGIAMFAALYASLHASPPSTGGRTRRK